MNIFAYTHIRTLTYALRHRQQQSVFQKLATGRSSHSEAVVHHRMSVNINSIHGIIRFCLERVSVYVRFGLTALGFRVQWMLIRLTHSLPPPTRKEQTNDTISFLFFKHRKWNKIKTKAPPLKTLNLSLGPIEKIWRAAAAAAAAATPKKMSEGEQRTRGEYNLYQSYFIMNTLVSSYNLSARTSPMLPHCIALSHAVPCRA